MLAKVEDGVLQVITRGLRKYNAVVTLVGWLELIATCAFKHVLYIHLVIRIVEKVNARSDKPHYLLSVKIKFTACKDIQYSPINITLALRNVHLQADQKLSVEGVFYTPFGAFY